MGTLVGAYPYNQRTAREQALWQLRIAQEQFRAAQISLRMAEAEVRRLDSESLAGQSPGGPVIELTAEPTPKD